MVRAMTSAAARAVVRRLARAAVSDGMPQEAAEYAATATISAITRGGTRPWTEARLAAYFSKVGRRRVVRRHGGTGAAARVVAECVVADLLSAGRSGEEAYRELARGWDSTLPAELLVEYRQRLCA